MYREQWRCECIYFHFIEHQASTTLLKSLLSYHFPPDWNFLHASFHGPSQRFRSGETNSTFTKNNWNWSNFDANMGKFKNVDVSADVGVVRESCVYFLFPIQIPRLYLYFIRMNFMSTCKVLCKLEIWYMYTKFQLKLFYEPSVWWWWQNENLTSPLSDEKNVWTTFATETIKKFKGEKPLKYQFRNLALNEAKWSQFRLSCRLPFLNLHAWRQHLFTSGKFRQSLKRQEKKLREKWKIIEQFPRFHSLERTRKRTSKNEKNVRSNCRDKSSWFTPPFMIYDETIRDNAIKLTLTSLSPLCNFTLLSGDWLHVLAGYGVLEYIIYHPKFV